MTENEIITAEALRRFRDRAGHLIELIAHEPDVDLWGDVLLDEATLIIKRGPAKYLRYVDRIDEKFARAAQLEAALDRILREGCDS